jgi:hypothetical protein
MCEILCAPFGRIFDMGYDYSLGFLGLHAELVGKLAKIATTGELIQYTNAEWGPIQKQQYLINNLLNSMARNITDMKNIRLYIRCWIVFAEDGTYQLWVGKPAHKVAGKPPGATANRDWMKLYVPAEGIGSATYVHPDKIMTPDDLPKFVGHVALLGSGHKRAEAKVDQLSDEGLSYFVDLFSDWKVRNEGELLILERD